MTDFIQVTTTVDRFEVAERIAAELVQRHLAACVQISAPIESVYWWQGKQERSREWQCHIKTRRDMFSQVDELVRSLHPYQTAEVIAVAIEAGSQSYLDWLSRELPEK